MIGFDPDPYQIDPTAAAVGAIYAAIHHRECTIPLAGPTGRQSGQTIGLSLGVSAPRFIIVDEAGFASSG